MHLIELVWYRYYIHGAQTGLNQFCIIGKRVSRVANFGMHLLVTQPVVELDRTLCGVGLKIWKY